jgi:TatD DNase family protein
LDFIDTHCHLNHESFSNDIQQVIDRAQNVNVKFILIPGWDLESSKKAVELAEKFQNVYSAVGIHPNEWEKADNNSISEIAKLALHPKVIAIGEVGLDYYYDQDHKKEQGELLNNMFSIADETHKPILLHSRESLDDLLLLLHAWKTRNRNGIMHAYEGDLISSKEIIDMGFYLGVGGPVTYKNAKLKKDVFSNVPLYSIVFETDAPYLSPVPHRGERNEPSYLPLIADYLAKLRNQEKDQIVDCIYQNSYKMFI